MNFTPEEEKIMIVRRFCYDIERDGVSAGLIERVSPNDEECSDQSKKEETDESITDIIYQIDRPDSLENLINQDGYTPLFPWFYGRYYTVRVEDGVKEVRENPSASGRNNIKESIRSLIEKDEHFLSLLRSIVERGRFGKIDHELLTSDKFIVDFHLSEGNIEFGSDEKEAKAIVEGEDGWSKHLILSSSTSLLTSKVKELSEINGFYVFIDAPSPGLKVCRVLIAGEIVSLIDDILNGYEKVESSSIHKFHSENLKLDEEEYSKFNKIVDKIGWETVMKEVNKIYDGA